MYLPQVKHTNTYKKTHTNPLWIIPLGIFTIVSTLPTNALAFEGNLAVSPQAKLVAYVQIDRVIDSQVRIISEPSNHSRISHALVATTTPVTTTGTWKKQAPQRVLIAQATVDVPVITAAPTATLASAPVSSPRVVLEGEASYYSRAGCLGCDPQMIMANGQPLNDNALTMAIGANLKQYVGYKARVTNLATGQSVVVTITDTGGFYQAKYGHRVADLTVATKNAIGMKGGLGQVRVEVL